MGTVILNGAAIEDSMVDELDRILVQILTGKGESFRDFRLREYDISPCRSCGSCAFRSPGKCTFDDDMPQIIRAAANSPLLVMLTPVRFGGYSSQLKKAVDRLMVMGLPLYIVKGGHLLHPTRYGNPTALLGIGVAENPLPGEEDAFGTLVARNALNMLVKSHKALVLHPTDSIADMEHRIREALEGVGY
ncbi:MAG: flavodoxin family protein [Firmicutes bacterium]|nr:flavodoxin family protein [Bacillota bacterium]